MKTVIIKGTCKKGSQNMLILKAPIINIKKTHPRHRISARVGKVKANNKILFHPFFCCSAVGVGADESIRKTICDGRLPAFLPVCQIYPLRQGPL